MIETLEGIKETIHYEEIPNLRLYHNTDYEDYPPHWHVGIEIISPIANSYEVNINNHDYHLDPSDILFINSGVLHQLKAPPSGERIILQFDLSLLYTLKGFDVTLFMLPDAIFLTPRHHLSFYRKIYMLLKEIILEYDSNHALKETCIYGLLIQIYALLCRNEVYSHQKFQNTTSTKQHEYIEKLLMTCEYINQHFSENLTLDQAADIAGFSKYHFTRLFKEFTNMTFHSYLNHQRITKAEALLMDANLSILDVALNSGFGSVSTFNRIFKAQKKCSPNTYRKKCLSSISDLPKEL